MGHIVEEAMPELPVAKSLPMGPGMSAGLLSAIDYREKQLGRAVREDELEPLNWAAGREKPLHWIYIADARFLTRRGA